MEFLLDLLGIKTIEFYDSALRALSTLRGLRGAPAVPPLCRETQSLRQQMSNAPDSGLISEQYLRRVVQKLGLYKRIN